MIKKHFKLENLLPLSFYLFLVFLPFGYRHLIYNFSPGLDEYESVFIYFNDLLLIIFLSLSAVYLWRREKRGNFKINPPIFSGLARFSNKNSLNLSVSSTEHDCALKDKRVNRSWPIAFMSLFLIFGAVSIFSAGFKLLALYFFARLALLALMAVFTAVLLRDKIISFEKILAVVASLSVFEGLVSFGQFALQRSLGLKFLGESVLEYSNPVVARIWVDGAKLLRAYGTFPHSNILAAFMVVGTLSFYYFLAKDAVLRIEPIKKVERKILKEAVMAAGLFFSVLGLILSFSRSGWLAFVAATAFVLLAGIISKEYRKKAAFLLVILAALGLIMFSAFGWAIAPRSHLSIEEPSVAYRISYDEVALILAESHPFGVGLGNQVIAGVSEKVYQKLEIDKLNWQPVHNIYLLALVETGIFGFIAFLLFIGSLVFSKLKGIKSWDSKTVISLAIFLALLFLGLFDHYLWDLEPGRLMFWLAVGIMLEV